jgi:hypothetical protein
VPNPVADTEEADTGDLEEGEAMPAPTLQPPPTRGRRAPKSAKPPQTGTRHSSRNK